MSTECVSGFRVSPDGEASANASAEKDKKRDYCFNWNFGVYMGYYVTIMPMPSAGRKKFADEN